MKPNEASKIIGRNIRNIRKIRGLSINDLAAQVGIKEDTLRKYERGERKLSVEEMVRFAMILNCSEQNFLSGLFPDRPHSEGKEIRSLDAEEHRVLEHIAIYFKGDRKALVIANGIYVAIPLERRREVIMCLEMQKDAALKAGEITQADLPDAVDYLEKAIGELYL